jgi:hypothetical protein
MALETKIIQLTEPDGETVWLITSWIEAIRIPVADESPPGTRAIIVMSGFNQAVAEAPDEIAKMLRGLGA